MWQTKEWDLSGAGAGAICFQWEYLTRKLADTLWLLLPRGHSTLAGGDHTPHPTLDTPHFMTLHTPNSTLHTPHSTLSTHHSTLYNWWDSTLYTKNSTLHTWWNSTLNNVHSTLDDTPHSTLQTPQYKLKILYSTMSLSPMKVSNSHHQMQRSQCWLGWERWEEESQINSSHFQIQQNNQIRWRLCKVCIVPPCLPKLCVSYGKKHIKK